MNLFYPNKGHVSFNLAAIIGILIIIGSYLFLWFYQDKQVGILFSDLITPIVGIISVFCLIYAAKKSKIYGNRVYYAFI